MWFSTHFNSQPVHCMSAEIRSLSAQSNIIFAPKPHIYYQNICILLLISNQRAKTDKGAVSY